MDAFESAYLALLRSGKGEPTPAALARAAGVPLAEARARAQVIAKGRARLAAMLAGDRGIAQRTPAWYTARDGLITASDVAQAIGKGKFVKGERGREELKWKKIERAPNVEPAPDAPFNPFRWGQVFETVACQLYQRSRGDVDVHEFGLLVHPTEKHVGCSPDGVTELGVMLEIKCPIMRAIVDGHVEEQYMIQMQAQMEVADLDVCDFIEVEIDRYVSLEDMEYDVARGADAKGAVLFDDAQKVAAYSPPGLDAAAMRAWLVANGRDLEDLRNVWLWGLRKMGVQRVPRDRAFWAGIAPQVAAFWADVEAGRVDFANGARRPAKPERAPRKGAASGVPPFPAALFAAIPASPAPPAPAPRTTPPFPAALFAAIPNPKNGV